MSASRYLTLTALAAALAGCAVGPDYQRPVVDLPAQYGESAVSAGRGTVQNHWWKLFGDAQLDQLVEKALRHNTDLLAAVARLEEAEAVMREAGATFFPEIDAQAGATRNRTSSVTATPMPAGTPMLRNDRSASLTTAFEIDLWGKLRRANEAARAQALSSRFARDSLQLTLTGLVSTAYLSLRALDAQVTVTVDTLASRAETLKIQRARLSGGVASALDVQQAENAQAGVAAQLAELRRQRAAVAHQLALLSGEPGLALTAGNLDKLPAPPLPPAGLPSSLLEARPDIRQAEADLIAANAKIGVAKAALFPTLSLTGALGSQSKALADLFSGPAGIWSLGASLTLPVFDAGRNSARIEQSEARQKQALANYRKSIQTAFKEVNDALTNLRENSLAEQAQATRLDQARQSLHLMELRQAAGYSGSLEVLDAQRAANDAAISQLNARQARLAAAVELFKALGGGWKGE